MSLEQKFWFSGINLKTPYLANEDVNLSSLVIQTQKFQLPCPPRMPRRAAESEAGWLTRGWAEATKSRVSITFGVVCAPLQRKRSPQLDRASVQARAVSGQETLKLSPPLFFKGKCLRLFFRYGLSISPCVNQKPVYEIRYMKSFECFKDFCQF